MAFTRGMRQLNAAIFKDPFPRVEGKMYHLDVLLAFLFSFVVISKGLAHINLQG